MPTYDRIHLASCLADAVRSAVENLRDDPAVSHLQFHVMMNGGRYRGETLYSIAYGYLEDGLVNCTCGAVKDLRNDAAALAEHIHSPATPRLVTCDDSPWSHYENVGVCVNPKPVER